MSSLFRDYVASVRPRGEPFRSRSMVLCLAGHHPVLSIGGNARRQGLKTNLCAPVPALSRSHPSVAVWLLNCGLLNNFEPAPLRCEPLGLLIKHTTSVAAERDRCEGIFLRSRCSSSRTVHISLLS